MKIGLLPAALALFWTAACAPDTNAPDSNEPDPSKGNANQPQAQTPSEKPSIKAGTEDPAPDNDVAPADANATPASIPQKFLGVWDATSGTCSRESDLRLEISPQQLVFYESLGQVDRVTITGEGSIEIVLAMEGEGESWEETMRIKTAANGNQIATSYPSISSDSQPLLRKRCPQ